MKVSIVGSRGIPARYGGFETFAEALSIRLAQRGIQVSVTCEATSSPVPEFSGVRLRYSKFCKARNPVRYYGDSLQMACREADVILVCGVGGALFYPMFRNCRAKIITHVDGREELRAKYSFVQKIYVRIAQRFANRYSAHLVCDSLALRNYWLKKFEPDKSLCTTIEYGTNLMQQVDESILLKNQLEPGGYFLVVCRMVPENQVDGILQAYRQYNGTKRLVLVGDVSGSYGRKLQAFANENILFLHGIYDQLKLNALRKNCLGYIHGHTVGGTNPSLLEAMAAGNVCICHDNEFNRETTNNGMLYFNTGTELASQLNRVTKMEAGDRANYARTGRMRIESFYNWERITEEYLRLFKKITADEPGS